MDHSRDDRAPGLAASLRMRARALHTQAEHSGIVADMLRGRASRDGYALLLRNLLPAYDAMERGLERHRERPALHGLALPALYRAPAIQADLRTLLGPEWTRIPPLAAATRYAERIEAAARGDGSLLIAHAYTRYLGDLSGGQTLRRLLAAVSPEALSFYAFPAIADPDAFKAAYRQAIDDAGALLADPSGVIEEAALAFTHNIEVSVAVQAAIGMVPC